MEIRKKAVIDNSNGDIGEDEMVKKILAFIMDVVEDIKPERGIYSLDISIGHGVPPKTDFHKVYEDFCKSKLYKEVYEGKSLGDVMPIEE